MPTIGTSQCPLSYPEPHTDNTNDLASFRFFLWAASAELQVPYELLVAQSYQEAQWKLTGYRYEPAYDRIYISRTTKKPGETMSPLERWSRTAAWKANGPTAAEWFDTSPKRVAERDPKRDWTFVAQTRIAASYGAMQVMYPTAVGEGFAGLPEELWNPENAVWGLKHLGRHLKWARAQKWSELGALKVALCRYNGGAFGNLNPDQLDDVIYVRHVERRYRAFWGAPFFADVEPA